MSLLKDMKKLFIIFNDLHLKQGNEDAIIRGVKGMIKYALENNIKNLVLAGDLFDSRRYQRLSVLKAFDEILFLIKDADLKLYMFPGNHDKTLYESNHSFLDIFSRNGNLEMFDDIGTIEIEGKSITMLPYFDEKALVEKIESAKPTDLLISHFAMVGSVNLGYTNDTSNITKKLLKKFKKTYLGHYHNHNEISKDIVHLPSFLQNNYGEDENKGFAVINENLSYTLIKGDFKCFKKLSIDINSINQKEIISLIDSHKNNEHHIRFEFTGDADKLKSLDLSIFKDTEISIVKKFDNGNANLLETVVEKVYDKTSTLKEFENFCDEKGYDLKIGKKRLLNFLKDK